MSPEGVMWGEVARGWGARRISGNPRREPGLKLGRIGLAIGVGPFDLHPGVARFECLNDLLLQLDLVTPSPVAEGEFDGEALMCVSLPNVRKVLLGFWLSYSAKSQAVDRDVRSSSAWSIRPRHLSPVAWAECPRNMA